MKAVIYVTDENEQSIYQQYNSCARYAKVNGYSISGKVLDFDGKNIHAAINKVVFDNEVSALIVYNSNSIGDFETALFYRIYLEKFNKKLIFCN